MESSLQKGSVGHSSQPFFVDYGKAYSSSSTQGNYKAYSSNMSPEDAAWWQNATMALQNHYSDLKNGVDPEQSQFILRPEDLQQLMQWMQMFAQQRGIQFDPMALGGGNFAPLGPDGNPLPGSGEPGPSSNPFGGMAGPNDNWVYNESESKIAFTGDSKRNDIWAYKNILDIPSTSATVTYEVTSDGLNPAKQVLKVIVTDVALKDPITGQSPAVSVYYYHNFEDPEFQLAINAPKEKQITGSVDLGDKIKIGKFQPGKTESTAPEASIEGELVDDNHYRYAGKVGEPIRFDPMGSGVEGEVTIHDVYGDAEIFTLTTDKVKVQPSGFKADHSLEIIVEHADGSKDIFYVRDEFKTNLMAVENYVQFQERYKNKLKMPGQTSWNTFEPGQVPDEVKDFFSLNSSSGGDGDSGINLDHPKDTPLKVSDDGKTGTSDVEANPEFHANYNSEVETIEIYANGTVTLHGATQADGFKAYMKKENSQDFYFFEITGKDKEGKEKTIIYKVRAGMVDKIIIDADSSMIEWPIASGRTLTSEEKEKIQVGLDGSQPAEDDFEYSLDRINTHFDMVFGDPNNKAVTTSKEMMGLIDAAIKSGKEEDWDKVEAFILGIEKNWGNNVMNVFIWGLVSAYKEEGATKLLKMIPEDIRLLMIQKANAENKPTESLKDAGSNHPTYQGKTVTDTVNFIESISGDSEDDEDEV